MKPLVTVLALALAACNCAGVAVSHRGGIVTQFNEADITKFKAWCSSFEGDIVIRYENQEQKTAALLQCVLMQDASPSERAAAKQEAQSI